VSQFSFIYTRFLNFLRVQGCQIKILIKSQTVLRKRQTVYLEARKLSNFASGIAIFLSRKNT